MNDFVRNVDMDYDAVRSALTYLEDHGEVCHKQGRGYVVWYLKKGDIRNTCNFWPLDRSTD